MTVQANCPSCSAPLPPDSPEGFCPACLIRKGMVQTRQTEEPQAAWTPPDPQKLTEYFPEFDQISLIGRGGMGAVYRVHQTALDRVVALKILPPQLAADPGFAERFAREARAMARLNHPHIVTLHESGQRRELFFFIMEYVDGANLRHVIESGGVSPREALAIIPQICEALQFAHDHGIVHRDIKPENILLDHQGRVKIADFGLARLTGGDRPQQATAMVLGTPYYMAPEQISSPQAVDHRADIYSLGVVFYQLLTGDLPIGRFDPPSRKVVIDLRLDEVVLRTLEKEPARRYQHATEVKTRVETIAAASVVQDHPGMILGMLLVARRNGKVKICFGGVSRTIFTLITVYIAATAITGLFVSFPDVLPYDLLLLFFLMCGMIFRAVGLRADQLPDIDATPRQYPKQSLLTGWRTLLRMARVRREDHSVIWSRLIQLVTYLLGGVIVYMASVRVLFWALGLWPSPVSELLESIGSLAALPLGYILAGRLWNLTAPAPEPQSGPQQAPGNPEPRRTPPTPLPLAPCPSTPCSENDDRVARPQGRPGPFNTPTEHQPDSTALRPQETAGSSAPSVRQTAGHGVESDLKHGG